MTTSTPMLFVFSQSEFESRCNDAKIRYATTYETATRPNDRGAIAELTANHVLAAFELWHDKRNSGFMPLSPMSPLPSVNVNGSGSVLYMIKPDAMQIVDLEVIYAQVRKVYEAELEVALEREVQRQITINITAAASKKLAAEQKALTDIADKTRKEMGESRTALRAKLIADGKLSAEGKAA